MRNLNDQWVLITGAGSGLGRLMSISFAAEGSKLVLIDIRYDLLEETRNLVLDKHPNTPVHIYRCDLSKRENIYEVSDAIIAEVGKIDILVNNAGIVTGKHFLECDDQLVQRTMDVNAMAHMWLAKKFLRPMVDSNHGHLVNIVSVAATAGVVGLADYCASKWAAFGFDESIRLELRKNGVTGVKTTCVCPFYINTGMFDGVKTPWYMPILDPDYVVRCIMHAVKHDKAVLLLPWHLSITWFFRAVLPTSIFDWLGDLLGISKSMDTFRGRGTSFSLGAPSSTTSTIEHHAKTE